MGGGGLMSCCSDVQLLQERERETEREKERERSEEQA